ncbi:MAG: Na+/H+ antiporter NhaA, partial [Rhodospirillales bacterium]|nr:Na+/H+ antiporter NhaA [Rhodospirillales bacterium]
MQSILKFSLIARYSAFALCILGALLVPLIPMDRTLSFALTLAFAALSVLGRRVPTGLKVFLTAVAIIDDLGAILVIALFYTASLTWTALLGALIVAALLYVLNRLNVRAMPPYLIGGAVLWLCVLHSGIHATLAGVMLAFLVPLGPEPDCVGHRIEARLSSWVTWAVLPLFGLANAGLHFGDFTLGDLGGTLILGTVIGLVIGKQVGVFGATLLALRLGLARLPAGVTYRHL